MSFGWGFAIGAAVAAAAGVACDFGVVEEAPVLLQLFLLGAGAALSSALKSWFRAIPYCTSMVSAAVCILSLPV